MTEAYDLVAIGAGPAGESAAELAAFYGYRAVVIEKNRPGGAVTTTGGAPLASRSVKDRPRSSGIPIVLKYEGVTA